MANLAGLPALLRSGLNASFRQRWAAATGPVQTVLTSDIHHLAKKRKRTGKKELHYEPR